MSDDDLTRYVNLDDREDNPYEMLYRAMLQDTTISFKARGILSYLISLPSDWKAASDRVAEHGGHKSDDPKKRGDGRDSVRAGMRELEKAGYLHRRRWRKKDGSWGWMVLYGQNRTHLAARVETFMKRVATDPNATPAATGPAVAPSPMDAEPETAGQAIDVFPGDGREESAGAAIDGFSGDGSAVDGLPVDGEPGDKEITEERNTPPPPMETPSRDDDAMDTDRPAAPTSGSPARLLCDAHGKTQCRDCNHNTRGASKVDAARERHEQREISMKCPWCPRSPDDNIRTVGVMPIAPATICDHVTPNSVILAQIAEREATEFGERPNDHAPSGAPVRSSRSDEARAEIAAILASKRSSPTGMRSRVAVERASGDAETRARVRAEVAEREEARIAALGLWPDEPPAGEPAEEVSERTSPAEQR